MVGVKGYKIKNSSTMKQIFREIFMIKDLHSWFLGFCVGVITACILLFTTPVSAQIQCISEYITDTEGHSIHRDQLNASKLVYMDMTEKTLVLTYRVNRYCKKPEHPNLSDIIVQHWYIPKDNKFSWYREKIAYEKQ